MAGCLLGGERQAMVKSQFDGAFLLDAGRAMAHTFLENPKRMKWKAVAQAMWKLADFLAYVCAYASGFQMTLAYWLS